MPKYVYFKSTNRAHAEEVTRVKLHVDAVGYEELRVRTPTCQRRLKSDPLSTWWFLGAVATLL